MGGSKLPSFLGARPRLEQQLDLPVGGSTLHLLVVLQPLGFFCQPRLYLVLYGTVVEISELRSAGLSRCSTAAMLHDRAPCLGTTLPLKLSHSQGVCLQQKDLQDGLITHVCDFIGHHSHFSIVCSIVSWGTPVTWASFQNPRKLFSDKHSQLGFPSCHLATE